MKSRNLPIMNFFVQLQKEYVLAELRFKIYKKKSDKAYYKGIMEHKKEKINSIASGNSLPSVLSDQATYEEIKKMVYDFGEPNFEYRDLVQKGRLFKSDIENYFSPGSDIKIKISEDKITTGKILSFDSASKTCLCEVKGFQDQRIISFSNIARILP